MPDNLPCVATGRWRYRLTEPVTIPTRSLGLIEAPVGYEWYIGALGLRLPPFARGLLKAALGHDRAYDTERGKLHGLWRADGAMLEIMKAERTPCIVRWPAYFVIRLYGALREPFDIIRIRRQVRRSGPPRRKPRR